MAPDIGARLQDLREATGWTQAQLARKVGRKKADTWRAWERGEITPDAALLEDLAEREGWPLRIFAEGGPMPSTVVNLTVNDDTRGRPDHGTPEPASVHLEAMRGVAEILADAFSRIADLLSADHPAVRQSPRLEAADRIVHASKDAEKAQEPARKRKDAG